MRTVLAIFFMVLATQAHSICFEVEDCTDEDICDKIKYTNIPRYKTEAQKRGLNCIAPDKTKSECNADVDEKYQELLARYTKQKNKSEMISLYVEKLEKQIDEKDKSIEWLKDTEEHLRAEQKLLYDLASSKKTMNMLQIISNNTGVENDIITTLQVIKGDFNKLSKNERLELQLVLKARGMYQAKLDGAWGKYSRIAFAMYLGPKLQLSSAKNPEELFKEIKKGFLIDELWERESFEKDLQEIWQTDARNKQEICKICSSGFSSGSRSSSSSRSTADDDSFEPFFKQMYINNELKNCLKVGNSWECD